MCFTLIILKSLFQRFQKKNNDNEENKGVNLDFNLGEIDNNDGQEEEESEEEDDLSDEKDPIRLKPLFRFECDFTKDRNITCMDFNKMNHDLLAVGYGEYDMNKIEHKNSGLIAFWTLKNPNFPEKMIRTENSVTSCAFSTITPNLLAIGDSAGGILIYDCQNDK